MQRERVLEAYYGPNRDALVMQVDMEVRCCFICILWWDCCRLQHTKLKARQLGVLRPRSVCQSGRFGLQIMPRVQPADAHEPVQEPGAALVTFLAG